MELNREDKLFNSIKSTEEGYSAEFKKRMIKILDKDNRIIRRLIHSYKEHYVDGISFKVYCNRILESVGADVIDEEFNKIAERIALAEKDISVKDILRYLHIIHFYKTYIGFLSETIVAATLENSGLFSVYADDTLDKEYRIDLVIKCNVEGLEGYKIGLQCKAHTFKDINPRYMEGYKEGNKKAITEGIIADVYYILTKDLNIMGTTVTNGLEHYESINIFMDKPFNFGSGYISIAEEEFIKELLYKFYRLKEEDLLKNSPFGRAFKFNIRNNFEEWYKLKNYGKIKKNAYLN